MSKGNRIPWASASKIAEDFKTNIYVHDPSIPIYVAGSLRRHKIDCGDIDLVIHEGDLPKLTSILNVIMVREQYELGFTKGTKANPSKLKWLVKDGTTIELYLAKPNALGAMLLYTTGSGDFNIRQRRVALSKGYKLSQYGLFKHDELIAGDTEEGIFKELGMEWLTPEQRVG
jgi:DNA polymerase (family 10)